MRAVVEVMGLEPTQAEAWQVGNLPRLPFPPHPRPARKENLDLKAGICYYAYGWQPVKDTHKPKHK
jgi:hypothetical protein